MFSSLPFTRLGVRVNYIMAKSTTAGRYKRPPKQQSTDNSIPSSRQSRKRARTITSESDATSDGSKVTRKSVKKIGKKAKVDASPLTTAAEAESDIGVANKPLFNLREIIADLIAAAKPHGLDHYVKYGKQFFIRVGTLCSGTDAPLHVMNLFGMLKNNDGDQVFTTINAFACEIEPFKQGFLMRNSKPQLLFRDARDFAQDGAKEA